MQSMLRNLWLALCLLGLLGGCSQVAQFTAADAANAAAIYPPAAGCFDVIGATAMVVGASQSNAGILSAIATKMAFEGVLTNPACAPIVVQALLERIKP
jgi:hypothetical protein